jgi:hypothetical protein
VAKRQPTDSRITIVDTTDGLRIVMPCRRSWFVICFLAFWICSWAAGEVMVANQLWKGDAPPEGEFFMLTWLGVWTMGGAIAIYAWLWQLMGKELLTVRGQAFTIRRDIGGIGFDKEYRLTQMRDLRVGRVGASPFDLSSSFQLWGVGGGVIVFDYGAKTIRFGAGLDEAETKQVVTAITQRFNIADRSPSKSPSKPSTHSNLGANQDF